MNSRNQRTDFHKKYYVYIYHLIYTEQSKKRLILSCLYGKAKPMILVSKNVSEISSS